jgi:predicted metal-binding membrane protein
MHEMPVPGDASMPAMWMPTPGQTWAGSAAFIGMWITMTAAMMLPSLVTMLRRYLRAVDFTSRSHAVPLTALVACGYLFVWAVLGIVVHLASAAFAAIGIDRMSLARGAPIVIGMTVFTAGAWQLTAAKARRLACCARLPMRGRTLRADAPTAWELGLRLGIDCARCCGNLMAIPLAVGLMDLRTMTVVGAAIALERLAPNGVRVAQVIGVALLGAGLGLVVRAVGLG